MLHLVRHGRPIIEPGLMASMWELDPAGFDEVWALRGTGRLPRRARWFSSPEPKALATAHLLTDGPVAVVDGLRDQARSTGDWIDDMEAVVRRAFADPQQPAYPGWEPLATTRDRVVTTVRLLLEQNTGEDLVLVGHGTVWTVVAAALTGGEPDLDRLMALGMPDVIEVDPAVESP